MTPNPSHRSHVSTFVHRRFGRLIGGLFGTRFGYRLYVETATNGRLTGQASRSSAFVYPTEEDAHAAAFVVADQIQQQTDRRNNYDRHREA